MKIQSLKTFVVGNPPPTWGGRYFIFVKLVTDTGIEGIGEVYAASFGPKTIVHCIEDVFEHHVLGADPFKIEALWRNIYGRGYSQRPDITLVGVLSGIEMALWDIIGKALDKPVHALLGGKVRERLRSYTYLYPSETEGDAYAKAAVYDDPDVAAERAAEYVAMGFTALKFDPAGPYSTFDPRQPSLERLDISEKMRPSAPRRICCSARTASSPHRARSGSPDASKRTTRCGSRSRCRRRSRKRWPSWRGRRRSRSQPASA